MMKKRLLSMLLAMVMVLSVCPVTAMAVGETDQELVDGAKALFSLDDCTMRDTDAPLDLQNITYHFDDVPYNKNYVDDMEDYIEEYADITYIWSSTGTGLGQGTNIGTVTRTTEDQEGVITLTLTLNDATATKTWDYKVLAFSEAEGATETAAMNAVADALDFDAIKYDNTDDSAVTGDLFAVQNGKYVDDAIALDDSTTYHELGANITWASSDTSIISATPEWNSSWDDVLTVTTPRYDTEVTLTATLKSPRFPDLVTPVTKDIVVTVSGTDGAAPVSGSIQEVLITMEDAYASETLEQNWENVAFTDVDFTTANKDNAAYEAIQSIKTGTDTGDVMKAILTLEMLGYDPANITLEDDTTRNALGILNTIADTSASYYFYTAPYVLLALDTHVSDTQKTAHIDFLCDAIVDDSNYGFGIDGVATAIAALAPYYDQEAVKTAVDTAMGKLRTKLAAGAPGMDACADAMVILACTMLGVNPDTMVYNDDTTVVDDLLSAKLEDGSGFGSRSNTTSNDMATRQGMLALKALVAYEADGQAVNPFDFSDATLVAIDEANVQPSTGGGSGSGDAGSGESITVTFSYAKENELVVLPHEVTVTGSLSEDYGLTTDETVTDPTVLDAAIAAHIVKYGDSFTSETAGNYMDGYLSKLFGDSGYCGNIVNGVGGDYANVQVIESGDYIETFLYSNSWSDYAAAFYQDGALVREIKVTPNTDVTLTVNGASPMGGGDATRMEGLSIGTTDTEGGFTSKDVSTGADSNVTLSFAEEGTYLLTSHGTCTVDGTDWNDDPITTENCPIVPAWCYVTVSNDITVTVNISNNGAFVTGKEDVTMAGVEVTLDGTEHATHNIDGALKQAHALYYDGVDGYASSEGYYGLSIDKLWGDDSGYFLYYLNGAMANSLADAMEDGDAIDAYITISYGESYSYFDAIPSATAGEAVTVTLKYTTDYGYTFIGCAGATIYIDGTTTGVVTDANGEADITFATAGDHWITAKKDANDDGITDIVAPYASATVAPASGGGGGSGSTPGGSGFDVTFSVVDNKDRTWFTETVELDDGDTVKDAFNAAFAENPTYTYEVDGGTYVESITHPTYGEYGEFTNGNNSGWKYKVNGTAPTDTAYSSYIVEEDDEIVFYFVVDYTTDSTPSSGGSFNKDEEEEETGTASAFTDVASDAWCYEAIDYVVSAGLFQGTTDTTFNPNGTMTRAMIWMVLARNAGLDTTADGDVWYAVGQEWAMENGISDGSNPNDQLTRQQLAVLLYRYAVENGEDVSVGENTNILSYTDVFEVAEYAIPAMQWACGAGIIKGTSESTLSPTGNATRAQVATMLMRYLEQ